MLVHLKLKNGDDLIAKQLVSTRESVTIENPIQVRIHPVHGFFAKSWMLLSLNNSVEVHVSDIMYFGEANARAAEYYQSFVERLTEIKSREDREEDDFEMTKEAEDVLIAYLESRDTIKH